LKKYLLVILLGVLIVVMGFILYNRNILSRPADMGDAPESYGKSIHYNPSEGPYFGKLRGDDDRALLGDADFLASNDDGGAADDEDAFANNFTPVNNRYYTTVFLPDIDVNNKSYVLTLPVNGAEKGDPVRAWIDFDGNSKFDDYEKAAAEYQGGNMVTLTWILPYQLYSSFTYARFRICKNMFKEDIEYPAGEATGGEDEDYVVRIASPVQAPSGLRNKLLLEGVADANTSDKAIQAFNGLKLGDVSLFYSFGNEKPNVLGINNMHDVSITGLRMGHDDNREFVTNPIVSSIKFNAAVEHLSFQLIDIDGGDRIKIEGFYKGQPVKMALNNLSDNYYYRFNSTTGEVYSQGDTDSGTDSLMPSSLDMAIEVYYKGYTDSISLSYFDDVKGSSGTYTLSGISCRKYAFDPYVVKKINTNTLGDVVSLSWNAELDNNVSAYVLERSNNGVSFDVLARLTNKDTSGGFCYYTDSSGGPVTQLYYYRVKTIAIDNSTAYSSVVRVRRNISTSIACFKLDDIYFTDSIKAVILTDMPGFIQANLYNYDGKLIQRWVLTDKRKSDTVIFNNLSAFDGGSFYLEFIHGNKKYLHEIIKDN
jgi:hypothetical protein